MWPTGVALRQASPAACSVKHVPLPGRPTATYLLKEWHLLHLFVFRGWYRSMVGLYIWKPRLLTAANPQFVGVHHLAKSDLFWLYTGAVVSAEALPTLTSVSKRSCSSMKHDFKCGLPQYYIQCGLYSVWNSVRVYRDKI